MKYKQLPDISTFDKKVDFKKVKKAGYVGVIIRAGYGQTNVDAYFHEHIQQTNKAGLPSGIYWFSYAWTPDMAKKEAQKCISLIERYKIDLPVYFDFEGDSERYAKAQGHPVSTLTLNQMAVAFCSEIQRNGYQAGIYFNKDYRDNKYAKEILQSYSQWYAYYNNELDKSSGIDLWQYTSTGEVPGIPAEKEDINYLVNENLLYQDSTPHEVELSEKQKAVEALETAINISYNLDIPVDGEWDKMLEAAVTLHYLYYKRPTIKNAHVSWLQCMLVSAGYDLEVDGSFGPATQTAVKNFQEKHKLIIDGWTGPNTHKKLIEVIR